MLLTSPMDLLPWWILVGFYLHLLMIPSPGRHPYRFCCYFNNIDIISNHLQHKPHHHHQNSFIIMNKYDHSLINVGTRLNGNIKFSFWIYFAIAITVRFIIISTLCVSSLQFVFHFFYFNSILRCFIFLSSVHVRLSVLTEAIASMMCTYWFSFV